MTIGEHRRANRLLKNYFVQLRRIKFPLSEHSYKEAQVSDISEGGLCVETKDSFSQGERLQVKVHVPRLNKFTPSFFKFYENDQEQYIHSIAEVSWVVGKYIGLRFLDLDTDVVQGLQGLIADALRSIERKAASEDVKKQSEDI